CSCFFEDFPFTPKTSVWILVLLPLCCLLSLLVSLFVSSYVSSCVVDCSEASGCFISSEVVSLYICLRLRCFWLDDDVWLDIFSVSLASFSDDTSCALSDLFSSSITCIGNLNFPFGLSYTSLF